MSLNLYVFAVLKFYFEWPGYCDHVIHISLLVGWFVGFFVCSFSFVILVVIYQKVKLQVEFS